MELYRTFVYFLLLVLLRVCNSGKWEQKLGAKRQVVLKKEWMKNIFVINFFLEYAWCVQVKEN